MPLVKTRIKKNDTVEIIAGNEKGKRGKVLAVNNEKGRAKVEGLNLVYKHQKLNRDPSQPNQGRSQQEASINLSNLMVVCAKCDKASKVGVKEEIKDNAQGRARTRRVRVCKKCGEDMPERVG
ncbi:MAG: 50S ribosomal protein L24 [Planctomycetota bacterium]|jgi:large subunit ribosomal protein L24